MHFRSSATYLLLALALMAGGAPAGAQQAPEVSVQDTGPQSEQSTRAAHAGHRWEKRQITLESGETSYSFQYSACTDPAHGEERPSSEGSLGMPRPSQCNWYHGGFFFLRINGKDATAYRLSDMRVVERGARGAFQMVWEHPDAKVGARFLMLPGANHVLVDLVWMPRPGHDLRSVELTLRCYPSYFTSYNKRQGDRHCATPRQDKREGEALEIDPRADDTLRYYDTVFDVAKGEGEGPCALVFAPEGIRSGRVEITGYPVSTRLTLSPAAGRARLAFYDFHGQTNAQAEAYLKTHGAADHAELARMDFRPLPVQQLQLGAFREEMEKLLAQAGAEASLYRPKVNDLLARVTELKAKAGSGDWQSEAELGSTLLEAHDLLWSLKIAALLNG